MTPFFESPLEITIKRGACHQPADTALVRSDWKLTAPDGAVAMAGTSAEILRKGGDRLWRLILDDAVFASRPSAILRMIPKSGNRFSEKIMLEQKASARQ